jgi:hypothetical protein
MNPLFEEAGLRGTMGAEPPVMDRRQLDLLRMIVQGYQGYGQQPPPGLLQRMLNSVTPVPRPPAQGGPIQQLGIRG